MRQHPAVSLRPIAAVLFALCTRVLCASALYARSAGASCKAKAVALSSRAQQAVDDFMMLRMELTAEDDTGRILQRIDAFANAVDMTDFTGEERLVVENFIVMERYNYLKNDDGNRKALKETLAMLRKRNADLLEKAQKAGEEVNKWLLCTAADVTSCYISFSLKDVIKYGLGIKALYQRALESGDDFSYGLTNMAQWYYWAPKLNGGSREKAAEYFALAVKAARNNAEEFFAKVFWSQWLFESGDKEGAKEQLDAAQSLCPGSTRITLARQANAQGMSVFAYEKKRSKMVK